MKRFVLILSLALALIMAVGCAAPADAGNDAAPAAENTPTAEEPAEGEGGQGTVAVAEDAEFVPVTADAKDFEALKAALADENVDEITLEKNVDVTESLLVDKTVIIAEGVTVTVKAGGGLYVDNGLVENKGAIVIEGAADANAACGVFAITNGGGVTNNGSITMAASAVGTESANSLGAQIRISGGTLENDGTVVFAAGTVASSGGVGDISSEGAFLNRGTVEVNGQFLRITGRFVNESGASLVSNSIIYVESGAEFDNSGTLSGNGTINETPIGQYQN